MKNAPHGEMFLAPFGGIDILVRPDDDPVFSDVPLHHAKMTDRLMYVRESEWPALKAALIAHCEHLG